MGRASPLQAAVTRRPKPIGGTGGVSERHHRAVEMIAIRGTSSTSLSFTRLAAASPRSPLAASFETRTLLASDSSMSSPAARAARLLASNLRVSPARGRQTSHCAPRIRPNALRSFTVPLASGSQFARPSRQRNVNPLWALPEKKKVGPIASCRGLWQGRRSIHRAMAMQPDAARGHMNRSKPGTGLSDSGSLAVEKARVFPGSRTPHPAAEDFILWLLVRAPRPPHRMDTELHAIAGLAGRRHEGCPSRHNPGPRIGPTELVVDRHHPRTGHAP
jgi:hypothetical protein